MRTYNSFPVAALLIFSVLTTTPVGAEDAPPDMDGRSLYVRYQCWQCHGYEGQGGAAPRVATSQYPFDAFARFVRYPNEMPAYTQELLSDEQLREIFKFLTSIPVPPEVDDIPALRDNT